MLNKKLIVINGFSRGGTNILWNVLQSHPSVVSSVFETGQLLRTEYHAGLRKVLIGLSKPSFFGQNLLWRLVDLQLHRQKFRNLEGVKYSDDEYGDNRFKYKGIEYTRIEIKNTIVCAKSLNADMEFNPLFKKITENTTFFAIIRNGYALCHGWTKRKMPVEEIGKRYAKWGQKMIEEQKAAPDQYKIIKFEDLVKAPFELAQEVYQFAGLTPDSLEQLRIRVKNITDKNGNRVTPYGEFNRKYWFTKDTIHDLLVQDVSETAEELLKPQDRMIFEREALPVLKHFGYA